LKIFRNFKAFSRFTGRIDAPTTFHAAVNALSANERDPSLTYLAELVETL